MARSSFLFSALAIRAVGRTAGVVVQEVRSQFADGGIMAGTKKPDYGPVIDICTAASLRELATPALLAVLTPLIIGFGINFYALGAFLAGVILTGQLMANFLSNSGGAWDNAKKYIEDGNEGGKGSEAHKAAVIGDTVGDPFKDTAGPALNPLIKVMNLVSLLVLPAIISLRNDDVRFVDRRRLPGRADRRGAVLEAQGRCVRRGVGDRRGVARGPRPARGIIGRRVATPGPARSRHERRIRLPKVTVLRESGARHVSRALSLLRARRAVRRPLAGPPRPSPCGTPCGPCATRGTAG